MDFLKKNLKYILIAVVVVGVIYYVHYKKEGCCGYPSDHDANSCPPGTKWNPKFRFCETPKTCQNTCFMSQEAHVASRCPDDSNLGDCLNAWCANECSIRGNN